MTAYLQGFDKSGKEIVGLLTQLRDLDELPEIIREFMQVHRLVCKYEVKVTIGG